MGKKDKGGGGNLGKALIRARFGSRRPKKNDSMLHTSEINDGYDWGRLNLQSVTEESSFQAFLSTAELAGTEFIAEKLNVTFVNPNNHGLLSKDVMKTVQEKQEENKDSIKIPRRPKWDSSISAHELQTREKEAFLEWRRHLAALQEVENLMLTPYEKNLEFWRQLWRVVERSDVIVQIVDARNPLLFRCEDLERYVKEMNPNKLNMILLNKADFLTEEQRQAWAKYFTDINVRVAFFSATLAAERQTIPEEDEDEARSMNKDERDHSNDEDKNSGDEWCSEFASESEYESAEDNVVDTCVVSDETEADKNEEQVEAQQCELENLNISATDTETKRIINSPKLLNRTDLVELFKTIYTSDTTYTNGVTTIGLVGYPNVGKSSTINALIMSKKVSVSATPGKTKHFQTLYLEKDLMLCDCPGLVMPSFISTKAEMILNGILPIDQMRDHVPATTLLATLIPRHVLEDLYGFMLPVPTEGQDPDRPPTSEELLNAHAYNRGFMTQNGQPDNPRSARYVLKDFVNGKLLYCNAPPTIKQEHFHVFPPRRRNLSANRHIPPRTARINKGYEITAEELDRNFFGTHQDAHMRGRHGHILQYTKTHAGSTISLTESSDDQSDNVKKPWKMINKHVNKNKRQKARRLYAHLDQH